MTDTTQTTPPTKKQAKPVRHTKRCSFDGCDGWAWAQGYCDHHYQKLKREGVIKKVRLFGDALERFMTRVDRNSETGCWEWTGPIHPHGYGQDAVHEGGKTRSYRAHRFAYANLVGPIPAGMVLRHRCDVRRCVNPDHLEPGTHAQNMRDCVERGRHWSQKDEDRRRLTKAMVQQIRILYARSLPSAFGTKSNPYSILNLAKLYGVESETVRTILKGRSRLFP